jgi:hypothetical protein
MVGQRSVSPWICLSSRLSKESSSCTAYDLMERPPTKWKWKAMLNKAVEEHHMTEWYNEVEDKTSLKYLTLQKQPNQKLTPDLAGELTCSHCSII